MSDRITILIADDEEITREGLQRILETDPAMQVIGEAGAINDAIWQVHKLRPDILLLDLKWFQDEKAGLDAIRRLRQEVPETRIIAITVVDHLVEPARDAGAHAAVTKHIHRRELLDEIRSVHALPEQRAAPKAEEKRETLSDREMEVLRLAARGQDDKEIAAALNIAVTTVKGHLRSIYAKLNVQKRAAAVAEAYKQRLITAE
jgi:DNA-binding NarL/FixJ family response regulator